MNRPYAAAVLLLMALPCIADAGANARGVSYGAAPALDCRDISNTATPGNWQEGNGVTTAFTSTPSGTMLQIRLGFEEPVATDMLHAAMNGTGARELALVEVEDTKGVWHKAWEGKLPPPAPGFEQTCFEQKLAQKQTVWGLRFTFRDAPGQIEINHAALLRR